MIFQSFTKYVRHVYMFTKLSEIGFLRRSFLADFYNFLVQPSSFACRKAGWILAFNSMHIKSFLGITFFFLSGLLPAQRRECRRHKYN